MEVGKPDRFRTRTHLDGNGVNRNLTRGYGNLPYNHSVFTFKNLLILSVALFPVHQLHAQQHVSFASEDGGKICADVIGSYFLGLPPIFQRTS